MAKRDSSGQIRPLRMTRELRHVVEGRSFYPRRQAQSQNQGLEPRKSKRECHAHGIARPALMEIIVNGDRRTVPENLTVDALLEFLQMRSSRVAIERNREILPRAQWQATHVQPNDSFEIVQFVGGG